MSKNNKCKEFVKILNVDHYSKASKTLGKSIMLHIAEILKTNICLRCNEKVSLDDFTIGHIISWRRCFSREGNKDLFWDTNNINLQHKKCNITDGFTRSKDSTIVAPSEFESNQNVKDRFHRLQLNFDQELLGMESGKANHQLFRKILFEWAEKAGLNTCFKCNNPIKNIKEWTIEHKIPWLSGETDDDKRDLFYDVKNIAFSHLHCNCGSAQLGKGKAKYNGVDLYINKRTGYTRWRSRIMLGKKSMYLGYYENILDAAEAYDLGVLKYRNGEGILNFPAKIDEYKNKLSNGWGEQIKCKICNDEHYGHGYCRIHHYEFCGGKEKRKERYLQGKG